MRVAGLLNAHPDGMRPKDIADRLGMSVRNVYRDLKALESELQMPVWSPGDYHVQNFAQYVRSMKASSGKDHAADVTRVVP